MGGPRRHVRNMIIFVIAVVAAAGVLFPPLRNAFMANAPLNALILGVFVLGVAYNFLMVLRLFPEVAWIESIRDSRPGPTAPRPRLLAPMATLLGERDQFRLSAISLRSLLDSISSRLDEQREMSRYTIGLLIFLGLLGTFWGLLQTIQSIGDVIGGLSLGGDSSVANVFEDLKRGLEAPMQGMGTAFSSSLFGLAGSLVLGFLDLQANRAQNNFYNDLEEWLSSQTRLSSGGPMSLEGEHSVPAYVQALLEQTAESLENLQRTMSRGEESRISSNASFRDMVDKLGTLTEHMRTEQAVMMRLAEAQSEIRPILARLADISEGPRDGGVDEATRTHIRNLDVYVARMLDEMNAGREEIVQEVRSEIKLLARTIAALSSTRER